MYPFLFRLRDRITEEPLNRWVVKIGSFNYKYYDSSWMCDDTLGENCLVLDVDQSFEEHRFTSEQDAFDFIKHWWMDQ